MTWRHREEKANDEASMVNRSLFTPDLDNGSDCVQRGARRAADQGRRRMGTPVYANDDERRVLHESEEQRRRGQQGHDILGRIHLVMGNNTFTTAHDQNSVVGVR